MHMREININFLHKNTEINLEGKYTYYALELNTYR